MLIYVHTLKCLHGVTNFMPTESEVPPGLALVRLENLEAEGSLGENLEVTLKEFVEDYFKSLTNTPFCIIGDLLSS